MFFGEFVIFGFGVFWPGFAALLYLAYVAWSPQRRRKRSWRVVSLAAISAAVTLQIIMLGLDPLGAHSNTLVRDAVAVIFLASTIPGVLALLVASNWRIRMRDRVTGGLVLGVVLALASPIILLLVHCTSGDCL